MDIQGEIRVLTGLIDLIDQPHARQYRDVHVKIADILKALKSTLDYEVDEISKLNQHQIYQGNLIKELQVSIANRDVEFIPQSELKPCPFLICRSNDVDVSFDGNGYHYHCYECMAAGPSRPTEREARKAWNERLP